MRRSLPIGSLLLVGLVLTIGAGRAFEEEPGTQPQEGAEVATRFQTVELFVDSGAQPLAAYQLEFRATAGDVKIVGIEGGEHPAFAAAPYYDPAAMQQERVIIAAFSTRAAQALPAGRTRIATVHVMISGPVAPSFTATLITSASAEGTPLTAEVSMHPGI